MEINVLGCAASLHGTYSVGEEATPSSPSDHGGSFKGGYDCEFVERPTEVFQTECSICLQVLREPHIISCCGHSFCRACIEETKEIGKSCPLCNEPDYTLMHNKGLERSLKELQVLCINRSLGCTWTGKLGMLDEHLNVDPDPDKQEEGCQYSEVRCYYNCGEYLLRPLLAKHQANECLKRPFSCDFCHEYESTFADVVGQHFQVCVFYQVSCPNYCTFDTIERRNLEKHLKDECPLQVIDCELAHAGCMVKLQRQEMPNHLKDNVEHVSLLAKLTQRLTLKVLERDAEIERLKDEVVQVRLNSAKEIDNCKAELKVMQREVQELQQTVQGRHVPVKCKMMYYEELKSCNKEWFSVPFYSHPRGYKMCLNVCPNGFSRHKGTQVSVFIYFMQGEHDSSLRWPFRGLVTIELLNQMEDRNHHSHTVIFDDDTPDECCERVLSRAIGPHGWGAHAFIANDKLTGSTKDILYLYNDCLCLRVSRVEFKLHKYSTM